MASLRPSSPTPQIPPPPSPSADAGIAPSQEVTSHDQHDVPEVEQINIFKLSPIAALKLLCGLLESLVRITGDVPPTPPVSFSTSTSRVELSEDNHAEFERREKRRSRQWVGDDCDVPHKAQTPIGSPEARPHEPNIQIVDPEIEPLVSQHATIARKFYSKKPPPISLEEYLTRLHKYCPMSTAVYLATSLYIHRLAIIEGLVPVTTRNVHRLVLAGLRVAMKALEDLSYPHSRFAKVGGVTEVELGRLEVSFCFVTDFNLRVTSEMLLEHAKTARDGGSIGKASLSLQIKLRKGMGKKTAQIETSSDTG
ncbi:uncharacterized protein KY384_003127 [Bacidia gigantensis]|uniref:uncharacterized protein n=1 Tax=Bacidia gigantensis TaxID=2732470 RepID=UPI001D051E0A|nr:uncharacterized protein KY384_003127 [Bacidia gigantensis]KAG8531498.1 hypothetical protein KY384_003127 [Bacidia gigantensis]